MPPLRWNTSLQTKISFSIILIVVSVLSISTYFSRKIMEQRAEEFLRAGYIDIVQQIEASIATREELRDTPALEMALSKLIHVRPNIVQVEIFEFSSGALRLRAKSGSPGDSRLERPDFAEIEALKSNEVIAKLERVDKERFWNILVPIDLNNTAVGLIHARISTRKLDLLVSKEFQRALAVTLSSALIVLIFLLLFLRRTIVRPIRTLVDAMARAEAGNLQAQAPIQARDELGKLAGQFNQMLDKIREDTQKIHNFNDELKTKVEQATQELNDRYQDLMAVNRRLGETQSRLAHSERLAAAGHVAATVAHRIGTPLTSVLSHMHRLKQEVSAPKREERMKIIESQVERVVKAIRELLDSVRNPARMEPVQINTVLEDLLNLVTPETALREIKVNRKLDPKLPPVSGDLDQLKEVFLNLLINAMDAMPDGGELDVVTELHMNPTGSSKRVAVTVSDNGSGIAEPNLSRIFEPFFTTKETRKGTGLGLSICKEIIEAHDGEIRVESLVGQGTRFTTTFPVSDRGK